MDKHTIAPMGEDYVRDAKVIKISDGDTIVVEVDMGYRLYITQSLRFNRINAPEMSTKEGRVAKNFLVEQLPVGAEIIITTYKNTADKYGRWLADIYYNDVCMNDLMVESGNAIYQSY